MKDLKIRVDNDAESREVQELFFELGYKWFSGGNQVQHLKQSCSSSFGYLVARSSGCFTDVIQMGCGKEDAKEITLPELRDLVVLKRNSIDDATHKGNITDNAYYVSSDEEVYRFESSAWCFSTVPIAYLKPIEKPMKEYLRKNNDGEYILEVTNEREAQEPHAKHWIEIPGGVNFYYSFASGDKVFTKEQSSLGRLLWQRKPPFSLNDQYAEIEKVRQDIINSPIHYADSTIECIDAMEAMMTPEQFIGYLRGNVFKYQWRYEKKNGIEDLKKAQWYLERLTEKVAEKNAPF